MIALPLIPRKPPYGSSSPAFTLRGVLFGCVRSLSFNPYRLHHLCSGGDDCALKVWDCRSPAHPVASLCAHRHWLNAVRHHHTHDDLVLSAGGPHTSLCSPLLCSLWCSFSSLSALNSLSILFQFISLLKSLHLYIRSYSDIYAHECIDVHFCALIRPYAHIHHIHCHSISMNIPIHILHTHERTHS